MSPIGPIAKLGGGVLFYSLSEISRSVAGLSGKSKDDFSKGNARYAPYKNVFANPALDPSALELVRVAPGEMQNRLRLGDVVVTGSSESLEDLGMSSVVDFEPDFPLYLNSFCFAVRFNDPSQFVPAFTKHLFRSSQVRAQIRKSGSGVTRINVSKSRFLGVRIPVPPLAVQTAIAQALDSFSGLEAGLEAELDAELEARRRQYLHIRGSLLATIEERARESSIGELFELRSGKFVPASQISAVRDARHPVPCFGGGGLRGYVSHANQNGEHVLIGRQGALCGNVRRATGEFYATEHAVVVTPRTNIDMRWAYHLLAEMNLNQYASKSAQPGLAVSALNELRVRVPNVDRQREVGERLDKLDTLVSELSVSLPAERAARRVQYEYYRDKLLTFEEAIT